jgi:copper chaperone NosL
MTIANEKFIAQCATDKGRVYYFDDISCMVRFKSENSTFSIANFYIADFNNPTKYLKVSEAILFKNEEIKSPMGGNIIAFSKQTEADEFLQKHAATKVSWEELN